ncbi:hypothetical protein [Paenibacillus koleovorans]|uniref:hypothetical protein n=1 Tax=Paenibacillus koleovorans TaxID=121608 RepID=UPI0013E3B0D4|nr:hypothetical protein [Paenibacillus koleovorans]
MQDNPQFGIAAFKLLYNLLSRISPAQLHESPFAQSIPFHDKDTILQEDLSKEIVKLLDLAFQFASEQDKPLYYSTGQISTYFGVSITTINNWLREKRLSYPSMDNKPSFKQARIPDTAIYKAPNGNETILREIIAEYNCRKASEPVYQDVERVKELVKTMMVFEGNYGGTYEEVVVRLGDPALSTDWKWSRDAEEWRYLMREISGER